MQASGPFTKRYEIEQLKCRSCPTCYEATAQYVSEEVGEPDANAGMASVAQRKVQSFLAGKMRGMFDAKK